METIEFKYQNIRLRVFSLIPLAVIFPLSNYLLRNILELKKLESIVISLVIVYLFLRCVCLVNGNLFIKDGCMTINETQTTIRKGKEEFTVANDDIMHLRAERIGLFGQKVACIKMRYKKDGMEKMYSIYSDDLGVRNVQECSAWNVYTKLKKDIFGQE